MAVSKREFDAYVRRLAALDRGSRAAVATLWPKLDHTDMESLRADLERYLPTLAHRLGKVAAAAAVSFYATARSASRTRGDYVPESAKGALWRVDRGISYAMGGAMPEASAPAFLTSTVGGVVSDYANATIAANAEADRFCSGYQSVPTSDNPCAFCIIKALNTWDYHMYGGERLLHEVDSDAWHDNCSCKLIPVWEDSPEWTVEQFRGYEAAYRDASDAVYGGDMPDELRERIDAARERHAADVDAGRSSKKWSALNEVTIAMRYQSENGMH